MMNAEKDEAAWGACSPAAGEAKPEGVRGERIAILIVSGSDSYVTRLAKQLAETNPGGASVALLSPGAISGNCDRASDVRVASMAGAGYSDKPPKCAHAGAEDFPAAIISFKEPEDPPGLKRDGRNVHLSAHPELPFVERRERERRKAKRPAAALSQLFSTHINHPTGGTGSSNLPTDGLETISPTGRERAAPPGVLWVDGAAHFDCDDRLSTGDDSSLITVMMASGREDLLKALLPRLASEQDIEVLGDPVADPAVLAMRLEQRQPRLLLLDKALLDRLGPQVLRMMQTKFPELRVLLLWDEVCCGLVEEVLRNRFHGFLLTSCSPDGCVKAIRAVSRGEVWLPRGLLAKALSDLLQTAGCGDAKGECNQSCADTADALTRRETQIVGLLRQGLSNKQIARQLGIMEDTVKKHLQSVFGKLGVRRRTLVVLHQLAGQLDNA